MYSADGFGRAGCPRRLAAGTQPILVLPDSFEFALAAMW